MASTQPTAEEQTLANQWQERVQRFKTGDKAAIPEGITGIGELRVMGRAGDARVAFPRVERLSDLQTAPADVLFGLTLAQRTVEAYQHEGAGRMVYATAPATEAGQPEPEQIEQIDPTKHADVIIVAAIAGGSLA